MSEGIRVPSTVWKGYISFGLVSFPVELYSAARADSVRFRMLHRKDLSRIKEVWYCAAEEKPVDRAEIVKGYETGEDQYIVVDDAELKAIQPATATTMDILQFVRSDEIDPIYFERSYYVAPAKDIHKPFALFFRALKEAKYSAIAKLTMHNREHAVLIRSSENDQLVLHTLFYADELNKQNSAAPPRTEATKKELELATALMKQLAAPFKADEFHDSYRESVEKLIEQKQKGKKVTISPAKTKPAPVIDLTEALRRSLKSSMAARPGNATSKLKKPPASKTARRRHVA